jgi:hypothetical protein
MELGEKTKALLGTDPSPSPNEGVFIHSDWKSENHTSNVYMAKPQCLFE